MARLPKWIFRFNVTSIKIPAGLFKETEELVLKFTRNFRRTIILKSMLRGKKKSCGTHTCQSQTSKSQSQLQSSSNQDSIGKDFPGGTVDKNPPSNTGDMGLTLGPGRSHMLGATKAASPNY